MRATRMALTLLASTLLAFPAAAQEMGHADSGKAAGPVPKAESSVTEHTIRIGGQTIPYRATAATMILKNAKDEPTGSLFYVAYTRTDVKDPSQRPIAFLYNGGPGSSTGWLHMGAFGPRRIITTNGQATPPAPYQIQDNANSLLDATDLVFIDAMGTGFSKVIGKGKGSDFWGVDQDAAAFDQFITRYISANGRWNSPKYLIGESYGTTRSAVLVNRLQQREGMDFNGVVLISSVLDFETLLFAPGHDISYILYLPSYAATAAYHHVIPTPPDLGAFLQKVRDYAMGPYADALRKGAALPAAERAAVIKQLSAYTGLSPDYLDKANLRVNLNQFRAELQRSKGELTGRLDSRFAGLMPDQLTEGAEYDPQATAITGAFTAAVNSYLRNELKFGGDQRYAMTHYGLNWDWQRQGARGWTGATYVAGDLAQALVTNPHLRVQIENGYYDLATPFFATEYTVEHMGLPKEVQSHIALKYYNAGHMMYLLDAALTKLHANIAAFIDSTSGAGTH